MVKQEDSPLAPYDSSDAQTPPPSHESKSRVPSNSPKKRRHPKKIACVECRQQKARCDACDKHPDSCTRCAKRGIQCVLDSDYKRTFKRIQIAQMEQEYQRMRRQLELPTSPGSGAMTAPPVPSIAQASSVPPVPPVPPIPKPITLPDTHSSGRLSLRPYLYRDTSNHVSPAPAIAPFPGIAQVPDNTPLPPLPKAPIEMKQPTGLPPPIPAPAPLRPGLRQSLLKASQMKSSAGAPLSLPPPIGTSRTIGPVTLSSAEIDSLWAHFVHSYHPVLPVVDISVGEEQIYRLCPILWWTIMFTALRGYDPGRTPAPVVLTCDSASKIYMSLSPVLKAALAELSIAPITRYNPSVLDEPVLNVCSVFTVQAFLLYTFWPPLTSSVSADSSWYTIGIAMFQAVRIGLHLPGHSADGLSTNNPSLLSEQVRTWVACNVVAQTVATAFGFPSMNGIDVVTAVAKIPEQIPQHLRSMLQIQRLESQIARTLNSNAFDQLLFVGSHERYPLLRLLETEIDQLEASVLDATPQNDPGKDYVIMSLYAARLHLLTYYFLDTDKAPRLELRKGLIKAYAAAVKFITHCRAALHTNKRFARHLPSVYTLTIWQAACIVVRLIHSEYKSLLDVPSGRSAYGDAVLLTHRASVMRHDMAYRASEIMRNMWALFKTLDSHHEISPTVTVRTRMAASVFFDSLWILRQKVGMAKLVPPEISASTALQTEAIAEDSSESRENSKRADSSGSLILPPNTHMQRSLSSTVHPESAAREIISTVPLDPQPISLTEPSEPASSSSNSSPFLRRGSAAAGTHTRNRSVPYVPPKPYSPTFQHRGSIAGILSPNGPGSGVTEPMQPTATITSNSSGSTPAFPMDAWDMGNDMDTGLLFKDIDSVMTTFGFHAE